jgi:hypothetical protein
MWIFTTDGFFSAVENRYQPDFILVRSRWKKDLERLLRYLSPSRLDETFDQPLHDESEASWNRTDLSIQETPSADYPFRMNVTKREWSNYLRSTAEGIDYGNFKDRIHASSADNDDPEGRLEKYFQVWAALRGKD